MGSLTKTGSEALSYCEGQRNRTTGQQSLPLISVTLIRVTFNQ